jgi:L-ascorbate metabolism protein UlaG (beta-lactamase superfamily)
MKTFLMIILTLGFNTLHAEDSCKITYISNEGFLIETQGKKVLIDGLFDHIEGNWCDSPNEQTLALMKASAAPFDRIDLIAITHNHRDHFNDQVVMKHLLSNPQAMVICPSQVSEVLSVHPDYEKVASRIIDLTLPEYHDSTLVVSGIPIRVMRLEHSHYMEEDPNTGTMKNRHRDIENLGYLLNIDGLRIFHCGDTNPLNDEEYKGYALQEESIDIAFLERMFVAYGKESTDIINNYIQPDHTVFMHINPGNLETYSNHFKEVENITIFEQKMDFIYYETSR